MKLDTIVFRVIALRYRKATLNGKRRYASEWKRLNWQCSAKITKLPNVAKQILLVNGPAAIQADAERLRGIANAAGRTTRYDYKDVNDDREGSKPRDR